MFAIALADPQVRSWLKRIFALLIADKYGICVLKWFLFSRVNLNPAYTKH